MREGTETAASEESLGKHQDSRENKTINFFPRDLTLSV